MRFTLFCLPLILALGCSDPPPNAPPKAPPVTGEDVKRDLKQAGETTGRYLDQKQEDFRREFAERLSKLDEDIARLKQKAAQAKEETRPQWEATWRELEEKRAKAQAKLEELKKQAPDAWDEFQQGAEAAWKELQQGYNKAAKELKDKDAGEKKQSPPANT